MTVPRLKAMTHYWKDNPPVHLMIAGYFGIGQAKAEQPSDPSELMFGATELPKLEIK